MRYLIIRFSSLGDIILTTPVVVSLAETHPDVETHFAVSSAYMEILRDFPRPVIAHAFSGHNRREFLEYAAGFAGRKFDAVFDLHANWRSRMLVHRVSAARVYTYPRDFFRRWSMVYLKRGFALARPVVQRYLEPIRKAGLPATTAIPHLNVDGEKKAFAAAELARRGWSPDRPTIGIGWGARWPTKKVPEELWESLLKGLNHSDTPAFLIFAQPEDRVEVEKFIDRAGRQPVFQYIDKSLAHVFGAVSLCNAFISSDSGLMHAAAALGVPTIGIFGPTHPALGFAPCSPSSQAVHSGIFCSPCSRHGRAPCYRKHRFCFDQIDVQSLVELVNSRLKESAAP